MPAKNHAAYHLKWPQVSAFRLKRHHLADPLPADLDTVCRDVCGIQCQVMAAAELALWARNHRLTRRDIQAAIWEVRSLIKTALMRGTLHLISSADFPLYISALRPSRVQETLRIMARYGVTPKEAFAVKDAVVETLGAGPLTRRELTERVLALNIVGTKARLWYEQSAWGVARLPIVEGFVCYGPDRAREVTFTRVDQWLPKQKEIPEREARKILLRRYLAAYGPATPLDFSHWTGFRMDEVTDIWESLGEELVEASVGDFRGAILRQDCRQLVKHPPGEPILRLLPGFDPYMLSHAKKSYLVDSRWYKRVYRPQWWISPVVLLNGRVVGTWSYTRRGKKPSLTIKLFEKLPRMLRDRIDEEAASVESFLAG